LETGIGNNLTQTMTFIKPKFRREELSLSSEIPCNCTL